MPHRLAEGGAEEVGAKVGEGVEEEGATEKSFQTPTTLGKDSKVIIQHRIIQTRQTEGAAMEVAVDTSRREEVVRRRWRQNEVKVEGGDRHLRRRYQEINLLLMLPNQSCLIR